MLTPATDYQTLCDTFRWEIPDHYNIGVDICDKWAHQPDRLALIYEDDAGRTQRYTFLDLKRRSNRLATGDVPRVLEESGGHPQKIHQRLEPHRGPGAHGR